MKQTSTKMITPVRCVVYTRKSSNEGLEMEFNSLDSQREACAAYIASQKQEGWNLAADRYDDGGFSGGSLDRPALKKLLDDVEAGRIDIIVVYKIDRLSRSLVDFTKLVELFDRHNVSFVSVTQSFSTTSSMGRLTLNILLSFAQFERELAAERVRDKHAASRKRGIWMGGCPALGYDVRDRKLLINPEESELIRTIFQRFAETGSATQLAQELNAQGHRTKTWTTSTTGVLRKGKEFDKGTLYKMLGNRLYLGEAVFKGTPYPGEHEAIIDQALWDKVQAILKEQVREKSSRTRAQTPAPLKGLIHCHHCNRAMTPTHTRKKGKKQYRYYLCMNAMRKGHEACPLPMIPAGEMEGMVFDHLRALIRTPELAAKTWRSANDDGGGIPEKTIVKALQTLDPVWDVLFPSEQARLMQLLVDRVIVGTENIFVQLRVAGLQSLVKELADEETPMERKIAS